ncbi:ABC transporter ATP-binding protein/permease [Paenibacillus polysaccharolyticus]|uniref:ABC transporter ATP-binding protein n=1 Tax=Paenibacillus polysaccharolyticus TaxID=582692 RepID=UPI00203EE06D|nr:ABC transporter ATP-binding protein [Paenibacillus polysaccharolyticus]MCM3135804.1 ABC transporter ATP-binding protein/permease [Paenibacillus polysaccharolyticus]
MIKKNKKKYEIKFSEIVIRVLGMAFAAGPVYLIINNIIAVVNGVSQGVITYVTQLFFNSVSMAISDNSSVNNVIIMAIALASTIILSQIVNGLNNFMGISYFKKVLGYFNQKINIKASKIDPIAYENVETLDDINKASLGANNSLGLLFTITTIFSYYLPYFIFMFIYLYSLDPSLALALIFVFVPVALSQFVRSIIFTKLEDEIAPLRREYLYYGKQLAGKETRILGGGTYFKELLSTSVQLLNRATWKAEKKVGLLDLGMRFITVLGYLGIVFLFIRSLLKGNISVGAFAAVYASIDVMFGTMNAIIGTHIANLSQNLGTIKNFVRFLKMPERVGEQAYPEKNNSVSIENVSFYYPGSLSPSLDNISLKIAEGETIAIVGENGSGKSTLVKILLGIYVPSTGIVKLAGQDTKKVDPSVLFKNVSAVFQKFQKYKMTFKENVEISDIRAKSNIGKIKSLSKEVGIDFQNERFPEGENTMISREFNGVELSGGQWQRLAIARGLYRNHNIIVLDEPTAAIDPIEELNVYNTFAEIAKDKTAIIVTHRLGSTKIADQIIVMEKGRIIEKGSHNELMNVKGKYMEMYRKQAEWYERDDISI